MRRRLREWRMRRGYSIRGLADRARVSRMTIFRIESGRSSPTVAVLEKFAQALAIEVRDLFPSARRGRRGERKGASATGPPGTDKTRPRLRLDASSESAPLPDLSPPGQNSVERAV